MSREMDKEYVAPLPEYPKLRPEAQGLPGEAGEEQDADYKFQREHKSSPLKQCLLAGSVMVAALGVLLSGGRLPSNWYPWLLPMADAGVIWDGGDSWQEPDSSMTEEELKASLEMVYAELYELIVSGGRIDAIPNIIRQNAEVLVTGQEPGTIMCFDGNTIVDASVLLDSMGMTITYTMEEYEECGEMMTAYRFQLAEGWYNQDGALNGLVDITDILCYGSYEYGFDSFEMSEYTCNADNGRLEAGDMDYFHAVFYPSMDGGLTAWMPLRLTGTLNEALHWSGELHISPLGGPEMARIVNVDENGTLILDENVYDARADETASTYYGTLYEPAGDKGYVATYYGDTVAFYPNFTDGRNWIWEAGKPTFPEPSADITNLGILE